MGIVFKCKMCGGDLTMDGGQKVGSCNYCGSQQTLPSEADEQKANLYNRANHFRMGSDFDKAIRAYEQILDMDNNDAEAHWGLVLSRFGIEYVKDPVSQERIPTLHRLQHQSILADADYLAAVEHAPDFLSRELYQESAAAVARVQKLALAITAQEQPYDVFICYKETDDSGVRTQDSVLAQDLYYQLTNEGYKVFFSRITLESQLGREYEPYIFAALSTAKVMLVIGTKAEYLNSTWVKNEWSRFLALMRQDPSRLLFPCYRDMDAYDLPEALSMLQSQDMAKIGFVQDILHGIGKLLQSGVAAAASHEGSGAGGAVSAGSAAAASPAAAGVDSLYKRMLLFLEDGDWQEADQYADRILDISPEHAPAYLGKLLAELRISREDELSAKASTVFADNRNYQKALRFADDDLRAAYQGYQQSYDARLAEEKRLIEEEDARRRREEDEYNQKAYAEAEQRYNAGDYTGAYNGFTALGGYGDAGIRAQDISGKHPGFWIKEFGGTGPWGKHEWRVLCIDGTRALLITKDVIVKKRFDESSNIWSSSEIRKWLNFEFLGSFSFEQQQAISGVRLKDAATTDKVFLLSIGEAEHYFKDNSDRIAKYDGQAGWWWLRSPGSDGSSCAAGVDDDGCVSTYGYDVNYDRGVRPALWLNLSSGIFKSSAPLGADAAAFGQQTVNAQAQQQAQQQAAAQAQHWESQGLCRYCGGRLTMFGSKCKSCGQPN